MKDETLNQKKCFNHCPQCDAEEKDIEWGDKEWLHRTAVQGATCNKCGCEFEEVYTYSYSECDAPIKPLSFPHPILDE